MAINKLNTELFKKILEVRPLYGIFKNSHSQSVSENIFKFYSDEKVDFGEKYKVLDEKDYTRFLSQRTLRRQPSLTRHLRPYCPEILGIPEDKDGLILDALESTLQDRLARGLKMPKVLYLIPTGNNPTGTVLPADRRRKIYEMACQYDFLVIEDDPYMFLNYAEESPPSFLSMDACGRVVRLDSGSKVLSAGMRLGCLSAPSALLQRAELHMQAEILHPCALSQTILYHLLSNRSSLAAHLTTARQFYERRRQALGAALRGVSELADWVEPTAGLFYWLKVRGVHDVYNMSVPENFFKFYSDDKVDFGEKYRVLDEKDYTRFLSQRALSREAALTRQITSLSYKVGKRMISLAEGMPNEEMFPFDRLELTTKTGSKLLLEDKELSTALQYVPSQGLPTLLTELRKFQQDLHQPPALDRDVLITNGAQHGIYQCMDMFVNPHDPVLTTEYSYTGLYSALRPYYPEILGIPEDEHGLVPETMQSVLQDRLDRGLKMPKILYLIPTGNNPTGTVLPVERRKKIYELACQYDFLIIEDDPYMFLNYAEEHPPSFLSMDACGRVVRLDSGSKVLSAGMRLGWLSAPSVLLQRAELHAQAELLHPCTLSQTILYRLLSHRPSLAAHLAKARQFYEHRRTALGSALRGVAELADWVEPNAGLFYWMRVRGVDDVYNMVFHTAFQRGLMLVPGHAFQFDTSAPCQYLRLTFSKIKMEDIDTALSHLTEVIKDEQKLALRKLPKRVATEL